MRPRSDRTLTPPNSTSMLQLIVVSLRYRKRDCSVFFWLSRSSGVNDWDKVLWLEYIAVHAAHKRRGIGLALVSAAKNFARKHHIKGLFTTLNIDNEESKSLLLKAEFDVKDRRIASYSPEGSPRASSLARSPKGNFYSTRSSREFSFRIGEFASNVSYVLLNRLQWPPLGGTVFDLFSVRGFVRTELYVG